MGTLLGRSIVIAIHRLLFTEYLCYRFVIHFDYFAIFVEAFVVDSSEFEKIIIFEGGGAAIGGRSVEGRNFGAYFCGDIEDFTVSRDFAASIEPSDNINIVVKIA